MTRLAAAERANLCHVLVQVGPAHPTLCAGWQTADLAAHLVLRERRPDAAAGIVVPALAERTASVQKHLVATHSYDELVELIRTGPPRWSPVAVPWLDDAVNTTEFFVHLEDVRRAASEWAPRALDTELDDHLWGRLRGGGRVLFRRAPCPVRLRRSGSEQTVSVGRSAADSPGVTLTGTAGELVLYAYNRKEHAIVDEDGDPDLIGRLREARLGV